MLVWLVAVLKVEHCVTLPRGIFSRCLPAGLRHRTVMTTAEALCSQLTGRGN